jgi:hypothetical protein
VQVDNVSLGYRIFFYLKSFNASAQSYSIVGNFRFEAMATDNAKMAERWTKNRREVYDGSDRHLLHAILKNRVKEEGFQLYTERPGFENVTVRSTIFSHEIGKSLMRVTEHAVTPGKRSGEYRIPWGKRLEIHYVNKLASKKVYRDVPYPVAWIESARGYIDVNELGVPLNTTDITYSGYMESLRVADLLPFDYQPEQAVKLLEQDVPKTPTLARLEWLREQVYLHTDRVHYYPGETVWLKGYMTYGAPQMMDTLSRVLHVELLDNNRKIVDSHLLRIDSGRAAGQMLLDQRLPSGNYYLRAYTQWMLNYNHADIFVKPLLILAANERAAVAISDTARQSQSVQIVTDKASYQPRQPVTLRIKVLGAHSLSAKADLSVSVTDMNQVARVQSEESITRFFGRDGHAVTKAFDFASAFAIEYGVSMLGQFANNKAKPEQAVVTVVQGNMEDVATVETNPQGKFWLTGFQFNDSSRFGFQVLDKKGKAYGKISLLPPPAPSNNFSVEPISLQVETTTAQGYYHTYKPAKDTRVLEEVLVKATREVDAPSKRGINYGKPDHVVTGQSLQAAIGTNLVQALQGRIPGLQVTWFWGEDGTQKYKIRIRGGTSTMGFGGTSEPLLLIDGIPVMDGGFVADQIAAINPASVDRIEVITRANPLLGVRGTNGAIAIYTKAGMLDKEPATFNTAGLQTLSIKGYTSAQVFPSPDYSVPREDHQFPDYRATVFWQPCLTGRDGSDYLAHFYTADLPGICRIVVQGLLPDGEAVYAESYIRVNAN